MDFIRGLVISINLKSETFDSILVIIDQHTKMLYYELIKITIDAQCWDDSLFIW